MPAVVFDAPLLIDATGYAGSTWLDWPNVPPVSSNPEADCLGVIASAPRWGQDFSLVVSHDVLHQIAAGLKTGPGLLQRDIDEYLTAVITLARDSGGGSVNDPPNPPVQFDPLLSTPLGLAQSPRRIVVAAYPALQALGPLWGPDDVPILSPKDFARRVDMARRAQ